MNSRQKIVQELSRWIVQTETNHPIRVAFDGVDAAGKTMLADEVAIEVKHLGRNVVQASLDGFHNPMEIRYRQGPDSPQGYYQDSFDYDALLREILNPLGPNGSRKIRQTVFDNRKDVPTLSPQLEIPADAILLFDGIFLLRPELVDCWDFSVFVEVTLENSILRGVERDFATSSGVSKEEIKRKYQLRYVPAQRLYFEDANPQEFAKLIFDNNEISTPKLLIQ